MFYTKLYGGNPQNTILMLAVMGSLNMKHEFASNNIM